MTYLVPVWLTCLLVLAFLGAIAYGTLTMLRRQVPTRLLAILTGLRLAMLVIFTLILLHPVFSISSRAAPLPELLVLVDVSQSMNKTGETEGRTQLDETRANLMSGKFAEHLRDQYDLRWFTVDATASVRDEAELAQVKPTGTMTDFAQGIESACSHVRAFDRMPRRVLLVSDGNDRGQADPVEIARRFGVTIDVLAPVAPKSGEAPSVAIAEVQSSRRVLVGSETHFRVTLTGLAPAAKDRAVHLRVSEDGKEILETPITLKAGRVEQTSTLTHRPEKAGLRHYEFALDGSTAKPYPVSLQVLDHKYEVLILEDRWRWEYKYLHRLFEDDPSFRFTALLSRGGGAFVQFGSPDRRVNLVGFPQGRADLDGFDCFVLGDVDPAKWPRALAADLARQIVEDGKSLVMLAGPGLGKLVDVPALHAICPVELTPDSGKPIEGPIELRMRSDANQSPFFFQLRGEEQALTPVDQIYPVLRKRAGATVLLEAAKERNAYGHSIVLAEHTVGRGRVLFVGTDTLWKWHTLAANNEGPTPYSILWQQAFRALAPVRSNHAAVNLWLTPSRSRVEVGSSIEIQADIQSSRALSATTVQGSVTLPGDKRVPLVFTSDSAAPRTYRAQFTCTAPGLQQISATLSAEGKLLTEGSTLVQADEPRGEQDALGVDHANLARIAQATGGRVIDPTQPDTFPKPDHAAPPSVPRVRQIDLWGNYTLMLLLCTFLAADWFLRLFKGLVAG